MEYKFYGAESKAVKPVSEEFKSVKDQRDLYNRMNNIWCVFSCAPRYRDKWSEDNKTVGQCSITSFLVQDIFGGKVYGVPLPEGGFHCFNVIGDVEFDLTSEQFGEEKLVYSKDHEQSRQEHFADEGKKERYEYLKRELKKTL